MPDISTYDYVSKQIGAMKQERSTFIDHYRELSRWVQPRRGRFLISDSNRGEMSRHERNNLVNSAGTFALRTARAGLLSGVMSPARPWFKLGPPDPELAEFLPVKEWLERVENIIRRVFNESNLYNMAPTMLGELLLFGTGAMSHVDDFDDVARFFTHTAGSYMLAQDDKYKISTIGREYQETVLQLVRKFGLDKVSTAVRTLYDRGDYHSWRPVVHLVEPNPDFDHRSPMAARKRFRSIYMEADCAQKSLLRESGFEDFPVYAPRWEVTGEDIYATDCPGMTALGDVKALQVEEKRKAQAIDKMVNPPLRGPAALKNVPVSSLPGGLTVYDSSGEGNGLAPIYMVNPKVQELMMDIKEVEKRIDRAFYVDMFLAISNMDGIQPRNEFELSQRNQERLLQIGPVLEQLHGEFLNRLIDRTFNQAWKAGILPPPPPELQGQSLKVEYISTLAMAQKAVATNNIDRLSAFVGGLAGAGYTGVLDKFDADQAVDEYAQALLVPAKLVVPDDIVAQRRQEREQAQRAALAMEMAKAGADVAKTASDAKTGEANALTRMIGQDEAQDE